ncbi:MAG TPA: ATP-binding protein [Dokdonella sp.]|uniref:ATP-binding protein n=1 Tax=Dokdonella sp. TaxID=2291710 RepID=UPI0025BC2C47|nr:ATP-binding protein [Dokdonella sp.]MBX3691149.1 two-component sensor histidine kinase [Dokdonella sp.]HNR91109.1 ATP-binding protein [Dokdonella sp.]
MARPLSLKARSLTAAGFVLAGFLGLAFFALDKAFHEASLASQRERLQGYVYAYLAGADTVRTGTLIPPEVGPDPRFDRPSSGLYAAIVGDNVRNAHARQWRSPSALGVELPFDTELAAGEQRFDGPLATPEGELYVLSQGIEWSLPNSDPLKLTVHVAEDGAEMARQATQFRRTLFAWLGGLGVLLLLLLLAVQRWSLAPLRKIAADLEHVERGNQERLGDDYPVELSGLSTNLNAFIDSERERLKRYRNTLSDLAHSLKTPLAVMRTQLETQSDDRQLRWTVLEQVGRMDEIVAYQLSRAATSGRQTFATPLALEPYAEEIVQSLEKVYADRNVLCEFDIDPAARFHGDQGDLLELLGNLLENAFKWARHRVLLSARPHQEEGSRWPSLEISIEDDGPGIPDDRIEHVLQRGVRGDERVQGHGIGLSIVQDIVRAYRGTLRVTRSPTLGGARFDIRLERN